LLLTRSGVQFEGAPGWDSNVLGEDELHDLLQDVRGDDTRLVRWNARKYTKQRQEQGGCDALPQALEVVTSHKVVKQVKGIACEYATFCITDNPKHRTTFSQVPGIHEAVVELVRSDNTYASAMASHLIYIASFSNAVNHVGFAEAGAVSALSAVIKDGTLSVQVMWAGAALQNLAASYCQTEEDGRCYWKWDKRVDQLELRRSSLPLVSDGHAVRQEMANDEQLITKLKELACLGPVAGKKSESNPFPGHNAVAGQHDNAPTVVAWAATGALKNLALSPEARDAIEPALSCFCRLSHSADWLEENKGQGVIGHLRRNDPCWFGDDKKDYDLCIDHTFLDDELYTCSDYGDASQEDCKAKDRSRGESAKSACCGCGGGDRDPKVMH
jgi:hypothetical protein